MFSFFRTWVFAVVFSFLFLELVVARGGFYCIRFVIVVVANDIFFHAVLFCARCLFCEWCFLLSRDVFVACRDFLQCSSFFFCRG